MTAIFADTFYWVALADFADGAHQRALVLTAERAASRIVTTDEVLTEYLTFFATAPESLRREAAESVVDILASSVGPICFYCKVIQSINVIIAMSNIAMRNTKVYSITMPPDLAKQAERLAKKENRTMSELMREALRRYQHPQVLFDPSAYIMQVAPPPPELKAIREDAKAKGTDKLNMTQINREVSAVRKQQDKKKAHRTAK